MPHPKENLLKLVMCGSPLMSLEPLVHKGAMHPEEHDS
jgi:hypothetical protein